LLGYLLGEAANAQYNDGKTSKPILDKLNYQGMDFVKVQRLALEVFEKLKQYKKLSLPMTEAVNACAMHILSKYSTNWPLNHLENVFYIVSGYAYCTNRVLRKAAERKEKQGEGGAADGKSSE
jgi:CRISPR-associated protein Csh1